MPDRSRHIHRIAGVALILTLAVLSAPSAFAAIPSTITYQGSLKQSGAPVNGSVSMEFKLTDAAGSQVYWTSGPRSIEVREGLYRVELNPTGVNWTTADPYIEVSVQGNTLLPREKLASAPYARMSEVAMTASSASFATFALASATSSFSGNTAVLQPGATAQGDLRVAGKLMMGAPGSGQALLISRGSSSAPGLSLVEDSDTGFFQHPQAPGAIDISNNGIRTWSFDGTTGTEGVLVGHTANTRVLVGNGTQSSPAFGFTSNGNSGFFLSDPGRIRMSLNGAQRFNFETTQFNPIGDNTVSLGVPGAGWTAVYAHYGAIVSSSSKKKREIRELVLEKGTPRLVPLEEVTPSKERARYKVPRAAVFKWKNKLGKKDDLDYLSFIGDDLPEEAWAIREDGTRDPEQYYANAVIGILCSAVRDLESRVRSLESQLEKLNAAGKGR